ncbi:molybdopterin molybdotransferase MoeA [Croceiramulus getboli]|nr:molybdopterin molybdotransferase MoeA [Flavobacteriaceae bacterium YJPT1-3]
MITVEHALRILYEQELPASKRIKLAVNQTVGHVLAQDLTAPIDLPPFRQSIMDGYALHLNGSSQYKLVGEIQAGSSSTFALKLGEAVRIFTGAPVPESANAVIMQEKTKKTNNQIELLHQPEPGEQIRTAGSQIKKGSVPLQKGHVITPASIGLFRSLGLEQIEVSAPPRISILVTGDELVEPGMPLQPGQIYESNGQVLEAALKQFGIIPILKLKVKDTLKATRDTLKKALDQSDLVLLSGGISVGDYDFVGQALNELKVRELFYKVRQKPGKPLFFGRRKNQFVFALPGNPASTLTCFYVYVLPFLNRWQQVQSAGLLRIKLPLAAAFKNSFGRALFLKARIQDRKVHLLDYQSSATLITFAKANALAYIPESSTHCAAGSLVELLLLPYGSSN